MVDRIPHLTVILLLLLLLTGGCQSTYIPTVADIPMHRRQGEIKASGYFGLNGFDLQASYAATRQLSVGLTANHWQPLGGYFAPNQLTHQVIEAKAGFYSRFLNDSTLGVDLRLGYGMGRTFQQYDFPGIPRYEEHYHRISFQPSFFLSSRNAEYGFASRFTAVSELYDAGNPNLYMFFIEPMHVVRFGNENLKMSCQIGTCFPINWDWYPERPLVMSVGVDVRLNTRVR